ncbi:uncharacterized protein LOC141818705 [Curcuma longa]|uniref:uncharacterized protein LOC141818705 n=1 Tax=Curcuma longa TaxID=136217 RepID=UPI003D9E934F
MDIVGHFPAGLGQKKFLLVAVDYFSKWVEADPLANITEKNAGLRQWEAVPRPKVTRVVQSLGIQQAFTSVYYPQSNRQTEMVNRELVRGLKIKLDHVGGSWVEELHDILWAYRATPRDSTGLTPFHLVYGGEAVVPVEIGCSSARIEAYQGAEDNAQHQAAELDLITEIREQTNARLFAYRSA